MTNVLELSEYFEVHNQIQLENSLLKKRNRLLLIGLALSVAVLGVLLVAYQDSIKTDRKSWT